jgi:hypothetical protein
MPQAKVSAEIIAAAIEGFEVQKKRIDGQIAELRSMLPGGEPAGPAEATRPKRKISAAARKRMAQAQKARWAKTKQGSEPTAMAEVEKPKRKISAAARRKMAEGAKKRWAAMKKAPGH